MPRLATSPSVIEPYYLADGYRSLLKSSLKAPNEDDQSTKIETTGVFDSPFGKHSSLMRDPPARDSENILANLETPGMVLKN